MRSRPKSLTSRRSSTQRPPTPLSVARPGSRPRWEGKKSPSLFATALPAMRFLGNGALNPKRCIASDTLSHRAAALADAQTVINLKRPWTKGHFRQVIFTLLVCSRYLRYYCSTGKHALWSGWSSTRTQSRPSSMGCSTSLMTRCAFPLKFALTLLSLTRMVRN